MMEWLKKRFFFRTIFSKLIGSFLLVIFIMSVFHLFSYKSYISNIEKEMTKNADERLNSVVNRLDMNFSRIKNMLLQIYMENNFPLALNSNEISNYYNKLLVNDLSSYLTQNEFIREIFVISEKSQYILTSKGTYKREMFFDIINNNPVYSEEFWLKGMKEGDFSYNFYKADDFTDNSMGNKVISHSLVYIEDLRQRHQLDIMFPLSAQEIKDAVMLAPNTDFILSNYNFTAFKADFKDASRSHIYYDISRLECLGRRNGVADMLQFTDVEHLLFGTGAPLEYIDVQLVKLSYFPETLEISQEQIESIKSRSAIKLLGL